MPKTQNKPTSVLNYDPNLRWNTQTIKITLGTWDYRAERAVQVGGNCFGFSVLEAAFESLFEQIREENSVPDDCENDEICEENDFSILMHREHDGADLLCEPDQDDCEEWLKQLVIGMEIVDIQKDKP